jgi:hypothetical protein
MNSMNAIFKADNISFLPKKKNFDGPEIEETWFKSIINNKIVKDKNHIFFIVYEAYENYETIKYYGYDNIKQLEFLRQNNFHIYHGIYSIAAPSIPSLSRVFKLKGELPDEIGISGREDVFRLLKKNGYKNYGIFQTDYFVRRLSLNEIKYDYFFPPPKSGANLLINAILGGEFSDKVSLEGVGYEGYLREKRRIIDEGNSSSLFMYSHNTIPGHRPSSTENDKNIDKYIDIYLHNLKVANKEMIEDVNLLVKNYPNAIIILAGDHGPFLTKNSFGLHCSQNKYNANDVDRYDIQDRYGAFLAIRWPEKDYATKHDIKILQDIFPAVFAYLFDDDSLFDKTRIRPRATQRPQNICGVSVRDGIIVGGKDDGKPLFQGIY